MLNPSRLYSFLDHQNGFSLHFLEGQKIIADLAPIHPLTGEAFAYFRNTVLGFLPLISHLKHGESLGIYLDSEEPYFRLKIETNYAGHTRTLLLPEDFTGFPLKITGKARMSKHFPNNKTPYTSISEFNEIPTTAITNQIIRTSYQTSSEVLVSEVADQSLILAKLPPVQVDREKPEDDVDFSVYFNQRQQALLEIFAKAHNEPEAVVKDFEKIGFAYLSSRQVQLFCPCTHEQVARSIRGLYTQDIEELFSESEFVEVKCDYCKRVYRLTRQDIENQSVN